MEEIFNLLSLGILPSDLQEMVVAPPGRAVLIENAEKIIDAINSCGCTSFTFSKEELQKLILDEDKR